MKYKDKYVPITVWYQTCNATSFATGNIYIYICMYVISQLQGLCGMHNSKGCKCKGKVVPVP
jgi:hypothetical protein